MFIRFRIPQLIRVIGQSDETSLEREATFNRTHGAKLNCRLLLQIDRVQSKEDGDRSYKSGEGFIQITISDDGNEPGLEPLVQKTPPRRELGELLVEIGNRCIQALRNIGWISQLHELSPARYEELTFRRLQLQSSTDGSNWENVADPNESMTELIAEFSELPLLQVDDWPRIADALKETNPYYLPDQFMVNAKEHLLHRNYRLAILETVIGLEVQLAEVLDEHLFFQTFMPKKERADFLSPELPLRQRLRLLFLILRDDDLKRFDMDKVIKVVEWRNGLVHGRKRRRSPTRADLPEELKELKEPDREKKVREHLWELETLFGVLLRHELDLGSADGSGIIAKKIKEL